MRITLFFVVLLARSYCQAQSDFRDYWFNDSTFYLSGSDTIIAGKNTVYLHSNGVLAPLYDFSSLHPGLFIRDLDLISDSLWYIIIGNKYIGGTSHFYRSNDLGSTWQLDTSYLPAADTALFYAHATDRHGLNRLQALSKDTLILFFNYYQSSVLYSIDGGQTWSYWFGNYIVHYYGIFECPDKYFIWSAEGDGFKPSMFTFEKSLLFSPDTNEAWTNWNFNSYHPSCYQGTDTNCIYAPSSASRYHNSIFYKNYTDSVCGGVQSVPTQKDKEIVRLFPNPNSTRQVEMHFSSIPNSVEVMTLDGQLLDQFNLLGSKQIIDLEAYSDGVYIIRINYKGFGINRKLILY